MALSDGNSGVLSVTTFATPGRTRNPRAGDRRGLAYTGSAVLDSLAWPAELGRALRPGDEMDSRWQISA
jgi:hypothetical protein